MNWTWRSLPLTLLCWGMFTSRVAGQITPAPNATGTTVTQTGQQFDIGGGTLSSNGKNLFHIFRDFNVGSGQTANFLSNPQIRNILAGVNGGNASYINGLLQISGGNSNLYLLNPAGIVFGANARLNLPAAFHASTAQRVHFDGGVFDLNGNNTYSQLNSNPTGFEFLNKGIIINEGYLAVGSGQTLSLMAHHVINTGSLVAPAGTIHLIAVPESGMVRVSQEGMLLSLEIPQERLPADGIITAIDLPNLLTGGGTYPTVNSVIQHPDGTISLVHDPAKVPMGSSTAVVGGNVSVTNPNGIGGQITVTGQNTALLNANLNASGQFGGGTILIGGDYLGGTTGTHRLDSSFNAQNLFINRGSIIAADALSDGNGGTIIAWADNATQFYGTITARGGQLRGDGGFVETSGRNILNAFGLVDASAVNGKAGTWLLDPFDVTIVDSNVVNNGGYSGGNPDIFSPIANATVGNQTIESRLSGGTNVEITGSNITVDAPIDAFSSSSVTLRFNSGNNITLNAPINLEASSGNTTTVSLQGNGLISQSSSGTITTDILMLSGSGTFNLTAANDVSELAGTVGGAISFVNTNSFTINSLTGNLSAGGNITLQSQTGAIFVDPSSSINYTGSGAGTITLKAETLIGLSNASIQATSGSANILLSSNSSGINIGNSILDSNGGSITINGTGGGSAAVLIQLSSLLSQGGNINITGTGSSTGVLISDSTLNAGGGHITLTGQGSDGGLSSRGIEITEATVTTTGSGNIEIFGTGGNPIPEGVSQGIEITDSSITTASGNILLEGRSGTGGDFFFNQGVSISSEFDGTMLISSSTGNVQILGIAKPDGTGVEISSGLPSTTIIQAAGSGNLLIDGRSSESGTGIEINSYDDGVARFQVENGTLTFAALGRINLEANDPNNISIVSNGSGRLVFQPVLASTTVGVGDGATGSLLIGQTLLDRISGGFSLVTIGNPSGTGLIDVRPLSLSYNLALQTPGAGSAGIQFNGSGSTNLNGRNLTLNSGGGVSQGSHAIAANTLQLLGQGNVNLSNPNNQVQALSGNVNGGVTLRNQGGLTITSFNNGVNGLTTGLSTNGNPFIVNLATGNLTQTAPLQVGSLGATLQNGSVTLLNPSNQIGTVAAQLNSSSDFQLVNNGTLTVGTVNPTGITGRNIFLQTLTGNIVLNAPITAFGSGDAIVLVAGNNFINNFGSTVFTNPNGRWLVYSTDPSLDVKGGLTGAEQFDTTYPGAPLFGGSGFLYRVSAPAPPSEPPAPPSEPPVPPSEPPVPPSQSEIDEDLGEIFFGEEVQNPEFPETVAQVLYSPGVDIIRQQIGNAFDQGDYATAVKLLEQLYTFEFSEYFGELFNTPGQEGLQNLDIAQIQALLALMASETGQTPALTYIFWRPDQLDIFIVTPTGEPIYQAVRVSQEELQRVISAFNREVRDPTKTNTDSYLPFAQQLYQWILGSVDAELQARGITTLVFAMDQGLRGLPIAALHSGSNLVSSTVTDVPVGRNGQFLVERYNLGLIPSINLVDTRYQPLQDAQVLAMGASEFQKQSPLPAVPIELQTITQLVGRGSEFLNETFTVQNLEAQRRRTQYPILHLATHSEFNPGKPDNSYIQFWDSQLSIAQLRQLRLFRPPTELMTLSACRTAVGSREAELGFAGLALQAGVKTSVASLWYVSDEGTLALMTEFYKHLGSAPIKAEALRQAQIAMLKGAVVIEDNSLRGTGVRGGLAIPLPEGLATNGMRQLSHPYFWAAFTTIGSPW
ncbi:CHAT domain-containing protein [Parathermosynechococcus lividus]